MPKPVSSTRLLALAALLLGGAWGCELTAELGAYTAAGGETTQVNDTGVDLGGTDLGDDESGSGQSDESDESGQSEAETETGEGDSGDGDGDPADNACMIDGSESLCQVCLEQLCCEKLESCNAEVGCFCMLECLVDADAVDCAMTCTPDAAYFEFVQCRSGSCAVVCD